MLTREQTEHLREIVTDYQAEYVLTYTRGAKEYGTVMSTLPALQMVREAKQEAQDSYAYNHTAESQLLKVKSRLTALKELLEIKPLSYRDQWFNADNNIGLYGGSTVENLEEAYDPIRRIEAIENLLFEEPPTTTITSPTYPWDEAIRAYVNG